MASWPEGKVYIGIDPGLLGGIGVIIEYKERDAIWHTFIPTPVIQYKKTKRSKSYSKRYNMDGMFQLLKYLTGNRSIRNAALEMPFAAAVTQKSAVFGLGRCFGAYEAMLVACGLAYCTPLPSPWMRIMHAGVPKMETKARSIMAAQRMFPGIDLRRTQKSTRLDDNKAEAILLAAYARRMANHTGE